MTYIKLTESGKSFIKSVCKGNGNSLLSGRNKSSTKDNPNGVLPHFNTIPESGEVVTWKSNAMYNGIKITTNEMLGNALIDWFDKYSKMYAVDANFIAAQAYRESEFKVWNYPLSSTASGISQFTLATIFDVIVSNLYSKYSLPMSQSDIDAITKNVVGNLNDFKNTFSLSSPNGQINRAIMHQNVTDNPEIMIKAQIRYIKYFANKYSPLASMTLFGYSRGPGFIGKTYSESIELAKLNKKYERYEEEGVKYVYLIFKLLYDSFGYTQLEMNKKPSDFDAVGANIDETNGLYG